ncbi:NrdA Ribonucleotide reductase, alpha subunit [uncultured Caudovirales phage]|uniref:Ribonucleoside-diphosphate reductase n=1 Tax=uncultured Caudovirales phage TaxID=2100421 RepID=A0A6J5QGR3_9CAUD|nr:NrdA Ribonucleotide reductase, alpha subunit [uncultured Caudovirales phage]CAB4181546.1 NrdA Ribonucleotide reductase, alpha subunit [uncultured Caudovirales phage]CAB4198382.1 NrdA Ribonucleotide reductase, alpha subunit [uncultured Caudovirales phage]CAB4211393.1 NrdA Ribonucleotide reductase, alpha subunit [uncultured Caudovirales phage]CAB5238437.1 NrdA Ribonucleotide reductase, alpha subunit [uncultured Caudovirales phage]
MELVHGITVDYTRDNLFDELGMIRLKESYMKDDEVSPQERFAFVSNKFGSNPEHAQRLYEYSSKHWLSYSTPILSFGRSKRGLPISCFLNYIEDTAEGLVDNLSETNWLSMLGGGVGIGFGIRSADDKSTGVMPHLKMYDASSLAYRQGRTRRGSYAAYLDISHPDIINFLEMRKPTGDQNMRTLNMHHGINIPDAFMEIIEQCMIDPEFDDSWKLVDPASNEVRETVSAKELWQRILEMRMMTGEPYLHFIDESNRKLPQHLKDLGLKVHQSNLCSEIILPTNEKRTAVCCLSSLNLEYYDDWKDEPQFLRDVAEMLDNVLQYFIDHAPSTIKRAKHSATRERSIGVGALGWHAYLQKNNLPWESSLAVGKNKNIFKNIREKLDVANKELGMERGEAPDAQGTGNRFSHLMAIAPNASSSILMGNTSPSIEPYRANAYRQDTLSGSHLNKNKYLDKVVTDYVISNPKADVQEIWSSIIANDGSVQHLDWLGEWEKDVFKTSMEIDQRWVIQHASDRQQYIDQAQSLNVFFRPDSHIKYIHAVHFQAWKSGLKTMYYCRSDKIAKADKVSKRIERDIIKEINLHDLAEGNECLACEG